MLLDKYLVSGLSKFMRGFYPVWRELLELIPSGSGSGIAYELTMPTWAGTVITAYIVVWLTRTVIKFFIMKKSVSFEKDDRVLVSDSGDVISDFHIE